MYPTFDRIMSSFLNNIKEYNAENAEKTEVD